MRWKSLHHYVIISHVGYLVWLVLGQCIRASSWSSCNHVPLQSAQILATQFMDQFGLRRLDERVFHHLMVDHLAEVVLLVWDRMVRLLVHINVDFSHIMSIFGFRSCFRVHQRSLWRLMQNWNFMNWLKAVELRLLSVDHLHPINRLLLGKFCRMICSSFTSKLLNQLHIIICEVFCCNYWSKAVQNRYQVRLRSLV